MYRIIERLDEGLLVAGAGLTVVFSVLLALFFSISLLGKLGHITDRKKESQQEEPQDDTEEVIAAVVASLSVNSENGRSGVPTGVATNGSNGMPRGGLWKAFGRAEMMVEPLSRARKTPWRKGSR